MPTVGNRTFPYTSKGRKQAKAYAKKTGRSTKSKKGSFFRHTMGMIKG